MCALAIKPLFKFLILRGKRYDMCEMLFYLLACVRLRTSSHLTTLLQHSRLAANKKREKFLCALIIGRAVRFIVHI